MKEFELFVPGVARTAGSHVAFRGRVTHAGKYTKDWMDKIAWFALKEYGERQVLHEGPVELNVDIYLSRPKGHCGTGRNSGTLKPSAPVSHLTMPDLDKLVRAIQDSLTNVIWKDDSQITSINAAKYYAGNGDRPGVFIKVKMYDMEFASSDRGSNAQTVCC